MVVTRSSKAGNVAETTSAAAIEPSQKPVTFANVMACMHELSAEQDERRNQMWTGQDELREEASHAVAGCH